jgi:hypothetical protein
MHSKTLIETGASGDGEIDSYRVSALPLHTIVFIYFSGFFYPNIRRLRNRK